MGFVQKLKARLGERYDVLREVSVAFQLGQMETADYCDLALDILNNDSQTLLRLVAKVPDAALRDSVTEYLDLLASSVQRDITSTASAPPPTASMTALTLTMTNGGRIRSASSAPTSGEGEAAGSGGEPCPICMDAAPSVRCEPCGHLLCKACLQRWQHSCANPAYAAATTRGAQTSAPCPFCRAPVKHYSPLLPTSPLPATPTPTPTPNPTPPAVHAGRDGCGPPSTSSTSTSAVVLWFRQDLRLADNPALSYAATLGLPVIPVFVLAPDDEEGEWPLGGASRYWLHHSLKSLDRSLRATFGSRLILRCPSPGQRSVDEVMAVIRETGAHTVVYNRVYEPWRLARDAAAEAVLTTQGIKVSSFNALLLYEPWDAQPDRCDDACWNSGFGSVRFFLRGCEPLGPPGQPVATPARLRPPVSWPHCAGLNALRLAELPRRRDDGKPIDWAAGIRHHWRFGEEGAAAALEEFVESALDKFDAKGQGDKNDTGGGGGSGGGGKPPSERFRADRKNTARISPYMHFGELGPRQVYHRVLEKQAASGGRRDQRSVNTFLRRLAWRDLAYWALWRFPNTALSSMRPQYESQRWDLGWSDADDAVAALSVKKQRWHADMRASADPRLRAWQRGETGYPLVDAAMMELWITGYMTNYMRHITAGFLIEYLNIDWRHGELWFHDTLIDADVAIQAMMWQNGGHSGMDQWNFVMHPVFAAKACDPDGDYVRQWLPQLRNLPREFIHCPWEAPATMLAAAGVSLGRQYPKRILIDLEAARRNSLAAVVDMRLKQGAKFVLPDGNEALRLPDGRMARCITRVDYKVNAKEPMTKQTAAAAWDVRRRPARDFMSVAMAETTGQAQRTAASRR